jgi:hypothetical protein
MAQRIGIKLTDIKIRYLTFSISTVRIPNSAFKYLSHLPASVACKAKEGLLFISLETKKAVLLLNTAFLLIIESEIN